MVESSTEKIINEGEQSLKSEIIEILIYVLISAAIIFGIRAFVVQHVRVEGTSMVPTLQDSEHLLVEKLSYKRHDANRYDIVVFNPENEDDDVYFVKRIIGLPNETVWIEDGKIHIQKDSSNEEEILDENYGSGFTDAGEAGQKIHIGKDEYFVLGDNRENSRDSRDSTVGLVKKDSIMGRAWSVIWPLNKFGSIEKSK